MELHIPRDPKIEIGKKIGIGFIFSIVFSILYIIASGQSISAEAVGIAFFFIGGIFFILGGLRDIFESILIRKLRGKSTDPSKSYDDNYFFGFGKAGEDIVAGFAFISLALLSWISTM